MTKITDIEDYIKDTISNVFKTKFNIITTIGFNSSLDDVKIITILLLSNNTNIMPLQNLIDMLRPYLIVGYNKKTDHIDYLTIDLSDITWKEIVTIIKLLQ